MSFLYLWKNRERPRLLSKRWLKVWAKRAFNLPALLSFGYRRQRLKLSGATLGELTLVAPGTMYGWRKRLTVGKRSYLGSVYMHLHAAVVLGDNVVVNDGVTILTASHDVDDPDFTQFAKPITIDDYAWIATGATLLPGVRIGKGAVIGAGAVIAKDVPDYAIAVGNPAKILPRKRSDALRYSPVEFVACHEAWLGTARHVPNPEVVYEGRCNRPASA